MKKTILALAVIAAMFTACSAGSKSLKTDVDSVSYSIGIDLGSYLKQMNTTLDGELDVDLVFQAVKDVMNDKSSISEEDAYAFLQNYFAVVLPEKAQAASVAFLADVEKNNKNVQKTESGLLYEIIEPGSELKPVSNLDVIKVTYEGKLKDGSVFDSTYERQDTVALELGGFIPGWSEGMKLIGKGGKIKLWIPAELAYGASGRGQIIGPNQALVFEVELVDVIPGDSTTVETEE